MDKSIHTQQYRSLIRLLQEERKALQMTQKQLAEKLCVQQTVISKIETFERRIDYVELRQICIALGLSPLEFIRKFEEGL